MSAPPASTPPERALAEDLLLMMFQPGSSAVAGEGTLYYLLAGAVLTELGLGGHVRTTPGWLGSTNVEAVPDHPPSDPLLRETWDYVASKPRSVQTVLPVSGPVLREPLMARLLARGDLRLRPHKTLGIFSSTAVEEGGTGRRAELLGAVRAVLVGGVEPTPRVAALAALVYGSGAMSQLDPDIPWNSAVIARAEELKDGSWGASAAAEAVSRTVAATILAHVIVAAAAQSR